ncbi:MAG: TolC family protein [Chitinispirillaceae bacterium]|nr:TolC family protein [Chitinispirillaceae bacterium]
MKKSSLLLVLIGCSFGGDVVSLHDAQRLMFENNSDLKAAELEINKMQQILKETKSSLFPSLDLSAGISYQTEKGEVTIDIPPIRTTVETSRNDRIETGIDCSYLIFTGFSRANAIKGVRAAIIQKEASLRSGRNSASFSLAFMYCHMTYFTRKLLTIKNHITTLEKYYLHVRGMWGSGLITKTKVLEVESKLKNTEVDLAETFQSVDSLRREIINLIGIDDSLCMPEENVSYFDTVSLPSVIDTLRSELQSLNASKQQLISSQKVIGAKRLPVVAATAGYRYGRPGLSGNSDEFMGYFIAGVQVKFNLFDGFKTISQLHQIIISQKILETNREASIDTWENALLTSKRQRMFLDKKIEAAGFSIEAASALVQSSKEQYEAGQLTQIEYLNAMDNDALARLRLEQVRNERRLIILKGLYLSGIDLKF